MNKKKTKVKFDIKVLAVKMIVALAGLLTVIYFSGFYIKEVFLYLTFYVILLFILNRIKVEVVRS